jgi:hypothetical protein
VREVVDLPDAQLAALDAWRATRGMSRAEAIKQAVTEFITQLVTEIEIITQRSDSQPQAHIDELGPSLDAAFGLWKTRPLDGLAEQERLRAEWDER